MMICKLIFPKPSLAITAAALFIGSGLFLFGASPEAVKTNVEDVATTSEAPVNTGITEREAVPAAVSQRSRSRGNRSYTSGSRVRQTSGTRNASRSTRGRQGNGRHGHRGHGRNGYRGGRVYVYPPYGYGYGLGFYYPGYYYSRGYYGPYGYGRYGPYQGGFYNQTGALDLNVKPKKAQVYLDGHFIGKAGKFDGWPSYLYLDEGTYELIFYLDGHETVRKEYKVHDGIVIKERLTLNPGESTPPELLTKKTIAIREPESNHEIEDHPVATRRYRVRPGERVVPRTRATPRVESGDVDMRDDPSRLELAVYPGDATVYLDGRFLGTGDELSRGSGDVIVDPGEHVIEVLRPGYRADKRTVNSDPGTKIKLRIDLNKE